MNAYFIFSAIMCIVCLIAFLKTAYSPFIFLWGKVVTFFMLIVVAAITALSYGTGPFSGA